MDLLRSIAIVSVLGSACSGTVRDVDTITVRASHVPICGPPGPLLIPPQRLRSPIVIEYVTARTAASPPRFEDVPTPLYTFQSNGAFVHGAWIFWGEWSWGKTMPLTVPVGVARVRLRFGLCDTAGPGFTSPCPVPVWYAERVVEIDSARPAPIDVPVAPRLTCTGGEIAVRE